jgi:hypothetical protein
MRKIFASGAVAIATVVLALTSSAGSQAAGPTSTAARAPARADAQKRLDSYVPPPGSRRVGVLPESLRLSSPLYTRGSPNFLDVYAFWVVPEPLEAVRRYLEENIPPGTELVTEGEEGDRNGVYRWDYAYEWPELAEVAYGRSLLVGVVAMGSGEAAIRADAQAIWVEPRPASERIPAAARILEVSRTLAGRTKSTTLRKPRTVAAIAKLIDGFGIVQRSGPHSCTLVPQEQATIRLAFRAAPRAPVLAQTEQKSPASSCDVLSLTIRGREQRPLLEGWLLRRRLRPILARL